VVTRSKGSQVGRAECEVRVLCVLFMKIVVAALSLCCGGGRSGGWFDGAPFGVFLRLGHVHLCHLDRPLGPPSRGFVNLLPLSERNEGAEGTEGREKQTVT
jgi:hypothetical protein